MKDVYRSVQVADGVICLTVPRIADRLRGVKLRVVQWGTGNVGRQSLRALLERDEFEVVGVHAHTPDKIGRDAAALCGLSEPTGVLAVGTLEEILALRPDACVHNPLWPDVEVLCALLEAGINVCTSAAWITGSQFAPQERERVARACAAGGASLYGSGAHPGLSNSVALALTAGCSVVDEVRIVESVDASGYASGPTMAAMGFGAAPDAPGLTETLAQETRVFAEAAAMMADALGATVDRYSFEAEFTPATADADLGFLQIPAGTVAGIRGLHRAWVGEQCLVSTGFNWIMGPHVTPPKPIAHGHVIQVFGTPNLRTVVHTLPPRGLPPEQWGDLGMVLTAMPVVNAVRAVVAAPPGILTASDIPVVRGVAAVGRGVGEAVSSRG